MLAKASPILGMLILAGCSASMTALVTMPIWLIFGLIFLVKLTQKGGWLFFTYLSQLEWGLIAIMMVISRTENLSHFREITLSTLGFATAWFSRSMMREEKPLNQRQFGYLLEVISVLFGVILILVL